MMPTRLRAWCLTASLATALALISCGSPEKVSIPKEVIPQDSMVLVLTDVHIVEGAKVGAKVIGDTLKVADYYNKVFAKHEISKDRFQESFNFYTENPSLMQKIYEEVIENLNKMDVKPERERLEEERDSVAEDSVE